MKNKASYTERFNKIAGEIISREGYLIADSSGNVPPIFPSGHSLGVIDPNQKINTKQGMLWWKKTVPVYAHIASFINHPGGDISATVFGRTNLEKVVALANKISAGCESREIEVGLATEYVKYGPDRFQD